ncbi:MAG: thioesterase family protein [Myxococcaceae bacterium]|nr:thioesterase family protein [Myxococcaceae bacterium]
MSAGAAASSLVRHRVEHVDTDASGIVHFSRYASLIETAALEELDRLGAGLHVFNEAGLELRVRELRITYRAAAHFRDRLAMTARIEHVGPASLRLSVQIHREQEGAEPPLLVSGALDFAVVNLGQGVPQCIPGPLKSLLTSIK